MCSDFKMVAPSFVTVTLCPLPVDCKILSYKGKLYIDIRMKRLKGIPERAEQNLDNMTHTIPLGPKVVLTKSAIAIAPTKEA